MNKNSRIILTTVMMLLLCLMWPQPAAAKSLNPKIETAQSGNLVVTWDIDDAATQYVVRYSIGQSGGMVESNVPGSDRRFVISDIGSATKYSIDLASYSGDTLLWSTSSPLSGYTSGEPAIARNATAITNELNVVIQWDRVAEVKDYRIQIKDPQGALVFSDYRASELTIAYADFNGITGKVYSFTINSRAYNEVMSSQGANGTFTIPVGKPTAPQDFRVSRTDEKSVTLEWSRVENIDGYNILRSETEDNGFTEFNHLELDSIGPNAFNYTDKTVEEGTTYCYIIIAFNKMGDSPPSKKVVVTVGPTTIPTPPTNLRAENVGDESFELVWDPSPEASAYNVYMSSSATGNFQKLGDTKNTSYKVTKLTKGVTVYMKVEAFNVIGVSKPSEIIDVTTGANGKLVLSAGKVTDKSVQILWTTNEPADVFYIYRSEARGSGYEKIGEVDGKTKQWTDDKVQPDHRYFYKVAIISNSSGQQEVSDALEVVTQEEGYSRLLPLILLISGVIVTVAGGTALLYLYQTGRLGKKKKKPQPPKIEFPDTVERQQPVKRQPPPSSQSAANRATRETYETPLEQRRPDPRRSQIPEPRPAPAPARQPEYNRIPENEQHGIGNTAAWEWFIGDDKPDSVTERDRWPTETPANNDLGGQDNSIGWTAYFPSEAQEAEPVQQLPPVQQPDSALLAEPEKEVLYLDEQTDIMDSIQMYTGLKYRKCPHCMTANPMQAEMCEICGAVLNS